MDINNNKQMVQRWFDALNTGDVAQLAALYTADTEVWTAGNTSISGSKKAQALLKSAGEILGLFPDGLQFEVVQMTAENNRVAVEAISCGQHISGQLYNNHYHFLIEINGAHIATIKEYMDTQHMKDVLLQGDKDFENN